MGSWKASFLAHRRSCWNICETCFPRPRLALLGVLEGALGHMRIKVSITDGEFCGYVYTVLVNLALADY